MTKPTKQSVQHLLGDKLRTRRYAAQARLQLLQPFLATVIPIDERSKNGLLRCTKRVSAVKKAALHRKSLSQKHLHSRIFKHGVRKQRPFIQR
jgi:hypothetical protein